jgi:pyridoxal phosphate enzyme (YggS family)
VTTTSNDIAARYAAVRKRIASACSRAGRDPGDVRVLAVSKTFPARRIYDAVDAGLSHFGENRVQEASRKIPLVRDKIKTELDFHLIGSLQRNKARKAAELFDVIETVDRVELARSLDRAAGELGRRLRILLQINLDAEPQKGGADPDDAAALAAKLAELPNLQLVGLMAIPAVQPNLEITRKAFSRLRELRERLRLNHPSLVELSMGMSSDFEVAIEEGATSIRIGTGLFGPRNQTPA